MSLDVALIATAITGGEKNTTEFTVFEANITHNLGAMAGAAMMYHALWQPERLDIFDSPYAIAKDLIPSLEAGLQLLEFDSSQFDEFLHEPPDCGMNQHDVLVHFVREYLAACKEYPLCRVEVSR